MNRVLLSLLLLATAAALTGCTGGESADAAGGGDPAGVTGDQPPAEEAAKSRLAPLPVEGVVVRSGPFVELVRATGRAEADRRAELALAVSGTVLEVFVREGDRVRAGDPLIRLDPRPFGIARDEARARLAKAESDFGLIGLTDSTLTAERLRLIEDRTGVTEARAGLARAELDLEQATLLAPFAGEIASVEAEIGERAPAERALVTLVASRPVRVRAEVLESDFGRLARGAQVTLRFPAFPGEAFTGTVDALDPDIDPDRGTGIAFVELPNEDGRIRPGMYADLTIAGSLHADRLQVPREAVLERDRRLLVFRATDGRAEWQYVETGLETRELVEITSGLAPGDTVLVDGHLTLAHAAPVRVKLR